MKILSEMYLWARKFPLNLGSHPDPDLDSEFILHLGRGVHSPSAPVLECVNYECVIFTDVELVRSVKSVIQLLQHKLLCVIPECVIREYEVCLYRSTELHHGLRWYDRRHTLVPAVDVDHC